MSYTQTPPALSYFLWTAAPVALSRSAGIKDRRQQGAKKPNDAKTKSFCSLASTLLYLGQVIVPQACVIASKMQQWLLSPHFSDIINANAMVQELQQLKRSVNSTKVSGIEAVSIVSFSNVSRTGTQQVYGQSKILTGLRIKLCSRIAYHLVVWTSQEQRKLFYSLYRAEILATAEANDGEFYLKQALTGLFLQRLLRHELLVD